MCHECVCVLTCVCVCVCVGVASQSRGVLYLPQPTRQSELTHTHSLVHSPVVCCLPPTHTRTHSYIHQSFAASPPYTHAALQAVEFLRAAINLSPQTVSFVQLGRVFLRRGALEDAIEIYKRAVK